MRQPFRFRLATVQYAGISILLITPVFLLLVLELFLPDEGCVNAAFLDRVFWTVTIIVVLVMLLVVLFIFIASWRHLFKPLKILSERMDQFAEGRPVIARERFSIKELDRLAGSVNDLMDAVDTREEKLQTLNENLEDTVRRRTEELKESTENLRTTREQLLLSEKNAVLGTLVAGVAHELNSPMSIGVTAASFLNERSRVLLEDYNRLSLTRENLERFLADAEESSRIIQDNLDNAARIMGSLKQVAADQQVDEHRAFDLGAYIEDVLLSLKHQLRAGKHSIHAEAARPVTVNTYPGAITQILNNLVFNSLIHGFEDMEGGTIVIVISKEGDDAVIRYRDDGRGLREDEPERIFEQFYTTRRGRGGTGLGMSIVADLVTETLGGSIRITPPDEGGAGFRIQFPVDCTLKGENE